MHQGRLIPPSEPPDATPETVEGLLERITYTNPENGWSVVRLEVEGRRDRITAVGALPGVQPGETLRLTGRWTVDRRFGEQFRVEAFLTVRPSTLTGMERYLGSGMVRGLGPVLAKRLVDHFELDTFDVIDRQPERLTEVGGIGPKRRERLLDAWKEQRVLKEVMVFLQSHGVSGALALRIYKQYGDRAPAVLHRTPYRLALDIHGIGFKTADALATRLGIARDAPERAEAGVLHALGALADDGHVFAPIETLTERSTALLEQPEELVGTAVGRLADQGHVVVEPRIDESGEVVHGEVVYGAALHAAETGAADLLRELCGTAVHPIRIDPDRAIRWFEGEAGVTLADAQRTAVRQALVSKLLVVTGGPGTGKTTLVNAIIRILEKKRRRIRLCAPTGRAARRLQETTGREAKTVHRLLELDPRSGTFQRGPEQLLDADVVIVDEVSMIDVTLLHHLLRAVPAPAQLVLVGDVDQLPSVGPGSVLRDVIRSGRAEVVELSEIFRQARESRIVVNAHRVNEGRIPETVLDPSSDFHFIDKEEPAEALDTILRLVSERIPRRFGVDPVDSIQVLTPMHNGLLGAASLNAELQQRLNPEGAEIVRGGGRLRVGDKVMQIRNNYDLDVYNGDIGRVAGVDEIERQVRVRFEREVTYDYAELDELTLAYACSIHKSQGSEYPCIVIPIHTQHYVMLQRNLLYTAITRGRKLVVVVGSARALGIAVRNTQTRERWSQLAARLRTAG